ncbi:hypothetical protein DSCA_55550 [Desulfosarcina alkanivorans]|uniref:Uncharacterized protein n=1 Tax=Desulfosarcina alkanivorans TaxID=571177 RepID=A0A5K7YT90_9BACT|nr:hypothetical protein DSCA_55550 [Desulfosarcina alkanivorans]
MARESIPPDKKDAARGAIAGRRWASPRVDSMAMGRRGGGLEKQVAFRPVGLFPDDFGAYPRPVAPGLFSQVFNSHG